MKEPAARLVPSLIQRVLALRGRRCAPPRSDLLPRSPFPPRRDLVAGEDEDVCILLGGRLHALRAEIAWAEMARDDGPSARRDLFAMQWVEALDDERFQSALTAWIENVPRGEVAACAEAWELRTLSSRCTTWMQQLAARAHRLPPGFAEIAAQSIAEQVRHLDFALGWSELRPRWLRAPKHEQEHGSHGLDVARTLCWAGSFFAGPEAARWRERGARRLVHALDACFLPDGAHVDLDAAAHARACAVLLECRSVLRDHVLRADLDAAIERACAVLSDRQHPDGCPSLLSGGGLHAGHPPAVILAAAQRLCGIRSVSRPSIVLDDAGVVGWRDGKSFFLFACGATGDGCRAVDDALAFEWTLQGERIFVAGAALAVTGACATTTSARTIRTRLQVLPDGLVAEGSCDRFENRPGRPVHRRLLRSTHNGLRIEDRVEGGAGQDVRTLLTCHPLARARQSSDGAVTIRRGSAVVRVESRHPITIEDAVWNPDAGVEVRTQRLVIGLGAAPCIGSIHIQSVMPAQRKLAPSAAPDRPIDSTFPAT